MDVQAGTCVCSPEMEVASPTGAEAEVNAAGLMTDRLCSAAPAALHVTHTLAHTQIKIIYIYIGNIIYIKRKYKRWNLCKQVQIIEDTL